LDNPSEIFEFADKFSKKIPLFIVPTTYFNIKIDDVVNKNIKGVIYANHGIRAAVTAMKQTFESIINNSTSALVESNIATLRELFYLQGMDIHNKNHSNYSLKAKQLIEELKFVEEQK
jgi:phosphoenolpyruvate phosphomutase